MQVESTVRTIEMILPDQGNHYGTLFGGNALGLLAKATFLAAARHAEGPVVMARTEAVDFRSPVKVGEVLDIVARVSRTGRSSMTVDVEATARSIGGARVRTALSGRFEMVAVDGAGRPRPVGTEIS